MAYLFCPRKKEPTKEETHKKKEPKIKFFFTSPTIKNKYDKLER
jgi:hypothetical protein